MSLIKCKACDKEISDDAASCPNCGAPVAKKRFGCGTVLLIGIIAFIGFTVYLSGTEKAKTRPDSSVEEQPAQQKQQDDKKITEDKDIIHLNSVQEAAISNLTSSGAITVETEYYRILIRPDVWNRLKFKQKEALAFMLAVHCGNKRGNHLYWAEIYDMYSGKKLAKYGSLGFKVY